MTASAPAVFRRPPRADTVVARVSPAEVAALSSFLLSSEASFITGAETTADGGYTMGGTAKAISDAPSHAVIPSTRS